MCYTPEYNNGRCQIIKTCSVVTFLFIFRLRKVSIYIVNNDYDNTDDQRTSGPVYAHLIPGIYITQTCPCNKQQFFTAVKKIIFR